MMKLRLISALLCLLLPLSAAAQDWPSRPVRFLVNFPAGGSTDVAARLLADYLSRSLGQQVFVENKGGASGTIGMETVARSEPDGYTVLISPDNVASAAHLFKLTFDPLKDLVPVVQISRQPVVLAVHPSLGVQSLAEFVELAKQRGSLGYATSGAGTQQHIVAEWFAKLAGINLELVPYRGGGQAINDLVAGHVKVGSLGSSPLMPHYSSGNLLLFAQSTKTRSPSLPKVPTYEEAGVEGLVLDQWLGVFVPAGTPSAITERLNREINKALNDPAVRKALLESAQEPIGGSDAQFAQLVREDYQKYERLVKDLNMKAK